MRQFHPKDCASCFTEVRGLCYQPGAIIVRHGEMPQGLFLIQSGLVKLEIASSTGTVFTLRVAKTGDLFGYRALLSDEPYYFSATAIQETVLCMIPKRKLEKSLAENPALSLRLIKQLASDLKVSDSRWLSQACEDAQVRVARTLQDLNHFLPRHHWTKKEIAQLAGTTTETVFRSLSKIKKKSN